LSSYVTLEGFIVWVEQTPCILQLFGLGTKAGNVIHSFLWDTGY